MKLLFDECLPKRLKFDFRGHETFTFFFANFLFIIKVGN
jgi:predicted nuclease of predicted toxin-antitoxin system